ncbi:PaaI family thioesterase [Rhodohalobacter sulfatireducens]|uniref:Hotdog fold thioesterase n=1 Tax=Rhodohalobacter sulfatireducens TaxID=2911366 RepID=A0ABS9KBE9_9BACT|nr:hotdog fold thioesterase [Rhodohalobacter sulfatireducens]MCG2588155.1 hotdog fold thioesterase [Rhodohalobacter sulfatireducens]
MENSFMNDSSNTSPGKIVNHMLENDAFSQWLGIELIEVQEGACILQCTLKHQMLNGYSIVHGGIIFSLADSAIAFASASFGRLTVAIDHSISFTKEAVLGDTLTAKAETISMRFKTGVIRVEITNQHNELVALVKGTVYRKSEEF